MPRKNTYIASETEDKRTTKTLLPQPEEVADENELVTVYVKSHGVPTTKRFENGRSRKFLEGKIMGTQKNEETGLDEAYTQEVEVECDKIIEVPYFVAHHFKDYI